jgi:hypothetical protein
MACRRSGVRIPLASPQVRGRFPSQRLALFHGCQQQRLFRLIPVVAGVDVGARLVGRRGGPVDLAGVERLLSTTQATIVQRVTTGAAAAAMTMSENATRVSTRRDRPAAGVRGRLHGERLQVL